MSLLMSTVHERWRHYQAWHPMVWNKVVRTWGEECRVFKQTWWFKGFQYISWPAATANCEMHGARWWDILLSNVSEWPSKFSIYMCKIKYVFETLLKMFNKILQQDFLETRIFYKVRKLFVKDKFHISCGKFALERCK